jgi:prepilin-type N-terminal cleavage/methylation domain-containing protein
MKNHRSHSRCVRGFSVTELVIVISIIGVLAMIALTSFSHLVGSAKESVARERMETLNQAVHRYLQQNNAMSVPLMTGTIGDEISVLMNLQYRDPNAKRVKPGTPYFDPRYQPVSSSSTQDHRLRWTGSSYELLRPGTAGTGIKMDFDTRDFTTARTFPKDFNSSGR